MFFSEYETVSIRFYKEHQSISMGDLTKGINHLREKYACEIVGIKLNYYSMFADINGLVSKISIRIKKKCKTQAFIDFCSYLELKNIIVIAKI